MISVTSKKSPKVYKRLKILTPLQKLPKNVRDLAKLFVAKGFKKLPKVQKIAQSGHPGNDPFSKLHSVGLTCGP